MSEPDDSSWLTQRCSSDADYECFVKYCYEDPEFCDHEEHDGFVVIHQNPPGTVDVLDSQGNFNVCQPPVLSLGLDPSPSVSSGPPILPNPAPPVDDRFGPIIGDDILCCSSEQIVSFSFVPLMWSLESAFLVSEQFFHFLNFTLVSFKVCPCQSEEDWMGAEDLWGMACIS